MEIFQSAKLFLKIFYERQKRAPAYNLYFAEGTAHKPEE
jgi:hypothetical protein